MFLILQDFGLWVKSSVKRPRQWGDLSTASLCPIRIVDDKKHTMSVIETVKKTFIVCSPQSMKVCKLTTILIFHPRLRTWRIPIFTLT